MTQRGDFERPADDCGCGWEVEYATVCTATPGVLHPTGNYPSLCPPEHDCVDGVMHRSEGTGWHNRHGQNVSSWYARHRSTFQQLTLEAA